jgi:SAM domain (Sterile alpha motif)
VLQPVTEWSVDNVAEWMAAVSLTPYISYFQKHGIDGKALLSISINTLGVSSSVSMMEVSMDLCFFPQ